MIRILHTNDFHGTLDESKVGVLAGLRDSVDLYFDSGDAIRTGNLGVPVRPEPVWGHLARLRCTASVLGNRETHPVEAAFRAKIAGATHPLLAGNMHRRDATFPLARSLEFDCAGTRVGVISAMVPMATTRMKTQGAWSYLWDPPVEALTSLAEEMRPRVDLLIALTHIGHRQDLEVAEKIPNIDVILGGHSHTIVSPPIKVGRTYVCQGGSHGRYAGVYEWEDGHLSGDLVPLSPP